MEIDKREEGRKNWSGYGSAERPAVIMCYHVVDKHGTHRLVSINDRAIANIHGDREEFERQLGERYRSFQLVGTCMGIIDLANHTVTLLEDAHELKRRCEELCAKHGEMRAEPWMPEILDQKKPDKTKPTAATTASGGNPSAPNDSRDSSTNELLAAISSAIFDRVAPVVAGTLKQGGAAELAPIHEGFMWLRVMPQEMGRLLGSSPAEADVAAAVAMFPAGVRALITARVDAHVHVSRPAGSLEVSIVQSSEPEFLFAELEESYDATNALYLVCAEAKDSDHTYVMVEFSAGMFTAKGWLDGEEAAQYAAEGVKSATGRPPDFRGTPGKSPK